MGVYQILSWAFDNPLWWFAELIFKGWGVAVMATIAILLNIGLLLFYRRKKVSWLLWNDGMEFLKEKEENFNQILQILSSWKALAVFFLTVILCNPDKALGLKVLMGILIGLKCLAWLLRNLETKLSGREIASKLDIFIYPMFSKEALPVYSLVIFLPEKILGLEVILLSLVCFRLLTLVLMKLKTIHVGDTIIFFFLSVYQDPFITTSYLRYGHIDGLRRRDIFIFLASLFVSVGYWIIRNGIIAEFLLRPILKI